MEALFFLSFGLIAYTYVLYPLLIAALGLLPRQTYRWDDASRPSVTLIISAYNEESVIEEKLRNTLAIDYPRNRLEVIVASEATDRTNDIVAQYREHGITLRAFPGRRGKAATLYRVMPTVRGDIVVFSDANALYRSDALLKLVRHFVDPMVGCVIGRMRYGARSPSMGGEGEGLYWKYDLWLRGHASQVPGLIPGINGAIFSIRKPLYMPISEERGDDYELCTRIAIHGYKVVFEPEAIAEEQALETTRQQFNRKSRLVRWNTVSTLLMLREAISLKRWPVAFQLVSHRLLRYSVPIWLIMGFVGSAILAPRSTTYLNVCLVQAIFYAVALAGWAADMMGLRLPRLCLILSYFLMVNSAAMVGLVASLSRGQVSTWQKTR